MTKHKQSVHLSFFPKNAAHTYCKINFPLYSDDLETSFGQSTLTLTSTQFFVNLCWKCIKFVTIMFEVLSSTLEGCRAHEETCCRKPTRDLNFFSPASNLIQVLAAECGPVDIIGPMQIQRLQRLNCCRNILLSTDTATCTLFL